MKSNRSNAIAAGILFIIAAVAAMTGRILYGPILTDPEYIIKGTAHEAQVLWGAFFEILTAFAVIGTPVALFPVLRKYNQSMAIATVGFRLLEATMIIVGILSLLTIVTLSHQFTNEINPDNISYLLAGKTLLALQNWTFAFGPNIALGPSTFMTGYLLYRSKLVPRFISILGMIGGLLISSCGVMIMFGLFTQTSLWGGLLAIPVFVYEMSLAIRLLSRGFNKTEVELVTVLR
ncbi:MAG TPA: DUF4386 domain-containing protein [Saprospiraceae bacterium]|nr:DUF4386 domain-containing protein [Saprospiraceae bacterium]